MALQDQMQKYFAGETVAHSTGLSVALGNVPGVKSIFKFGTNTDVGTTEETIWAAGGLYVTPTTATVASIASTSVDDTAAGTGARTILIQGLDEDFLEQEEIITLNGQTIVQSVNTYIRLNRMFVLTAGSSNTAAGQIVATVDAKTVATIPIGFNQTQVCHYTIPADKNGYLNAVFFGVGQGKEIRAGIYVRPFGSVYRNTANTFLYQSVLDADFTVPPYLPPKTDIELRAVAATGTVNTNGSMTIVLVDREE